MFEINAELAGELGLSRFSSAPTLTLFRPAGCDACDDSGYRGRTGILELLVMSDAVRQTILNHGDAAAIHSSAAVDGTTSMHDDGLRMVVAGITSLEELERVTREA